MNTARTVAKYLQMDDDGYVNSDELDPSPYIHTVPVEVVAFDHHQYGISRVQLRETETGETWWVTGDDEMEDIRVLRSK